MSDGRFFRVSGKKVALPMPAPGWSLSPRPGGWLLATGPDGRRERVMVLERKGRLMASLGGTLFHGELVERQRSSGGPGGAGGDADLVAQFPGKVRKILVAEGEQAAEGQPLVLVEAMKMEFAVKAPYAGRVTKLLVKEGQQLAPGDRLVELEAGKP